MKRDKYAMPRDQTAKIPEFLRLLKWDVYPFPCYFKQSKKIAETFCMTFNPQVPSIYRGKQRRYVMNTIVGRHSMSKYGN